MQCQYCSQPYTCPNCENCDWTTEVKNTTSLKPSTVQPVNRLPTRNDLLGLIPHNGVAAELGVAKGSFAAQIWEVTKPTKLYLIDKWVENRYWLDDGVSIWHTGTEQLLVTQKRFLKPINDNRVIIIIGDTAQSIQHCPDAFDLIYIDAAHDYDSVTRDINAAWPKVKPNGWMMGHDYCPDIFGVKRAVDEFIESNKLRLDYLTEEPEFMSWAIQKL